LKTKKYIEESKILVADDDENTIIKIKQILDSNGFTNVVGKSKIMSFKELNNYEINATEIRIAKFSKCASEYRFQAFLQFYLPCFKS
jgi:hypothetical protein